MAQTAYPGPARYGAVVADDVTITMDNGVVLEASIAYPTDKATDQRAPGRFPVPIEHSPYALRAAEHANLAAHLDSKNSREH